MLNVISLKERHTTPHASSHPRTRLEEASAGEPVRKPDPHMLLGGPDTLPWGSRRGNNRSSSNAPHEGPSNSQTRPTENGNTHPRIKPAHYVHSGISQHKPKVGTIQCPSTDKQMNKLRESITQQ